LKYDQEYFPVRISVRDTIANRVLAASTVARVRVTAPARPSLKLTSLKLKRMRPTLFLRPDRRTSDEACVTSAPKSATRAEAGFVLVAVLWILAALATLAGIYSSYTANTAAASRVPDDRVQAEASIRAGVEMAVFRQLALPEKARPTRGGFDMRVGRTGVAVRFRSEAARIDLNAAPPDLLAGLFTAVGVDSGRAEAFAERIVGWRTKAAAGAGANANAAGADANAAGADNKDDKAAKEDKLYSQQHMPYPPRHAPFDSTLELSLLPGVPLAVVERVLPFVTVSSGRPEVDVSGADPTVLSALPGMTPQILGAVLNARVSDPGDGTALLNLLGPAKAHATADRSKAFRASISVEFDNGRRVHAEVVFRLNDQGGKDQGGEDQSGAGQGGKHQGLKDQSVKDQSDEPYELLYWRDDFDGPTQSG
jgi:general secretion pathway protein K